MIDMKYLNEDSLYTILVSKFGDDKVTRQYKLGKKRVDFLVKGILLPDKTSIGDIAVEFDGAAHYQKESQIYRDIEVHVELMKQDIHVIHIPYFVQSSFALPFYFNDGDLESFHVDKELLQYPNGFIDKKCIHPIDFSVLGWHRFVYEKSGYPTPIRESINETMTELELNIYSVISNDKLIKNCDFNLMYDEIEWMTDCLWG